MRSPDLFLSGESCYHGVGKTYTGHLTTSESGNNCKVSKVMTLSVLTLLHGENNVLDIEIFVPKFKASNLRQCIFIFQQEIYL